MGERLARELRARGDLSAPGDSSSGHGSSPTAEQQVIWGWMKERNEGQGSADLISHENGAGISEIIVPEGSPGLMEMTVLCVLLLRVGINNDLKVAVHVRN